MTGDATPNDIVMPDVHSGLATEHGALEAEHEKLAAEHKKLAAEHKKLAGRHRKLAAGEDSKGWLVRIIEVTGAVLVAVISLVTAYQVGQRNSSDQAKPASSATTVEAPAIATISYPMPNRPVPRCTTVQGTAEIPQGKALAVAAREETDERLYFEGKVELKSDKQWSATLELGNKDSAGNTFAIQVFVLDKALKDYLAHTNATPDATWWSSEEAPPGARSIAQIDVQRSRNSVACS